MPQLKAGPAWMKELFSHKPIGVDRNSNTILGYVVAQKGAFKSGRGQFTDASLQKIVDLGAGPSGLKSRFGHPTLSADGLASYLGRAKNLRLDGGKVRADLHLDPSSFDTPNGNLAAYVMSLAESDPDALSSSLVLQTQQLPDLDEAGNEKVDADGELTPPIWIPTKLHASDIVDTGDACDGLLSAELDANGNLPDIVVRQASGLLTAAFPGLPREEVKARCEAFLNQYLNFRYGDVAKEESRADQFASLRRFRQRLREREAK